MKINNSVDAYNLTNNGIVTPAQLEEREAIAKLFPAEIGRRRAVNTVTWEEAVAGILRPLGFTPEDGFGGSYTIEFEESWGVSCTLYINQVGDWDYRAISELPNGARVGLRRLCDTKVELSWSSTTRDVETSLAAINLYQRVLGYAATLRASLAGKYYMSSAQWAELLAEAAKTPEQVAEEQRAVELRRAELAAEAAAKTARAAKAEAKRLAKG